MRASRQWMQNYIYPLHLSNLRILCHPLQKKLNYCLINIGKNEDMEATITQTQSEGLTQAKIESITHNNTQ